MRYLIEEYCLSWDKVLVSVKNVEFGDCNIIENNKNILVVDCGSRNKGANKAYNYSAAGRTAYEKIQNDLYNTSKSCQILITHYHVDHMNGIKYIENDRAYLKKIYLPCTFLKENHGIASWIGALSELFYFAPKGTYGYIASKEFFSFLEWLKQFNKKQIQCLKWKDEFTIDRIKNVVLWPRIECDFIETKDNEDNCIKYILTSLYEILGNIHDNEKIMKFLADEIKEVRLYKYLIDFFEFLEDEEEEHSELLQQKIARLNNEWQRWRRIYDNIWSNMREKDRIRIKAFVRIKYHKYITQCNEMSIVFHEKGKSKYIFLGDVSKRVIDFLKDERERAEKNLKNDDNLKKYLYMRPEYEVIKVQHHGTTRYFTENMPKGKKYIISNGGYKQNKISSSLIQFIRAADNGDDAEIYCTNGKHGDYCEYKQKYSCSECNGIDGDQTIVIDSQGLTNMANKFK